jgi:hypothetical protein
MTNTTWYWKLVVSAALAATLALSGWTLGAIANMPKEYTRLEQFEQLRQENRQDHKEILDILRSHAKEKE